MLLLILLIVNKCYMFENQYIFITYLAFSMALQQPKTKRDFSSIQMASSQQPKAKRKCRQYSMEYLKFGFVTAPNNPQIPLCLICDLTFSNEMMKPCKMKNHIFTKHPSKADKDLEYFKSLEQKRKRVLLLVWHPIVNKKLAMGCLHHTTLHC